MYKIIIITIMSLLFSSCSLKEQSTNNEPPTINHKNSNHKIALIVAVSDYSPETSDLPGIKTDINRIKNLLDSWEFNTTILYNKDSIKLKDYLKKYKKTLNSSDTFVFYYTGHGSYTKDINGDEDDGKDETIVLSDGSENMNFLDDDLGYYFSHIKAKKLLLFDSCHSGTAFKSPSNIVPKSILSKFVRKVIYTGVKGDDNITSEYIAITAAQDSEESLASEDGSFFTSVLIKQLSKPKSINKSFKEITDEVTDKIVRACEKADVPAHHPKLSASNKKLEKMSIKEYLGLK